jgi:hypothetical protein
MNWMFATVELGSSSDIASKVKRKLLSCTDIFKFYPWNLLVPLIWISPEIGSKTYDLSEIAWTTVSTQPHPALVITSDIESISSCNGCLKEFKFTNMKIASKRWRIWPPYMLKKNTFSRILAAYILLVLKFNDNPGEDIHTSTSGKSSTHHQNDTIRFDASRHLARN